MSSEQRSNSAVRNLRSLFENKSSENIKDARGRSPGTGTLSPDAQDQPRPVSRVRASFIPVQPTMAALAAEQQQNGAASEQKRESSVGLRRASMSEGHSGDALEMIRDAVEGEAERRDRTSSVAEIIPEQAIETPALEDNNKKQLGGAMPKVNQEPENPDKPVTGEQEEPAIMKPADPASEQAVSGGEALPPVAEDLRKDTKATSSKASTAKPSSISTKAPKGAASSVKSPKAPLSSTSNKAPTKKPSRSSLTAPTAASVARAAAADAKSAPAAKPKPRETTKPMDISSRLTAPTAASRARLESATNTAKAPAPSRPQPKPASARPTPRTSLAGRPDSRSSQNATKKPTGPVDSSFLERMSRPTAASSARVHEKTEVKSPPRQKQLPIRPKANGHPKPAKAAPKATAEAGEETILEDESILPQEEEIKAAPAGDAAAAAIKDTTNEAPAEPPTADLDVAGKNLTEGNETPVHTNGMHEDAPAFEDTPAAIGGEDSIR